MRWLISRAVALLARLMGSGPGRAVARHTQPVEYGWGPSVMSELRKAWILFRHPHTNIQFKGRVHIGRGFSLYMPSPASTLIIGDNVEFRNGVRIELVDAAKIVIGDNCVLSYNMLIQCIGLIEIGDGCGIGQSCAIFDGNHRYRDLTVPFMTQGFELRSIKIGKECGILTKTTIVNDIGDRCVIGANSVVAKPIPSYCVAAGVPAKVIDYFGPPGEEPEGWTGKDSES
jgi:acetyltransferase-like isoleucine patch superfamily enzyme